MSTAEALYRRAPGIAKGALAAGRGVQLRRWRYGPDAEDLVDRVVSAEHLPPAAWDDLIAERTGRLLRHAAATVPYYRRQWGERRRRGDRSPVEDLASWPVLYKAAVRADPWSFTAEPARRGPLFAEHTSGTTGTPLALWWSRAATRCWYALFEARTRRWHGVSRHQPWAILGGQLVVAPDRRRPPYWVWNPAMHQLYLSSHHLDATTVADYVAELRRREVTHLVGYPSALAELARLVADAGGQLPGVRVVLTNAESLLDRQRTLIEAALGVPVRDMFGQAEIVAAASECGHGTLHRWPEAGVVEVLDDDGELGPATPPGELGRTAPPGRLVATGLLNPAMPLIRYDTGDRLVPPEGARPCPCGRTLPVLGRVEGRADDLVITPDGRRIGRLDPVFKADLPLVEAQIHQIALDRLVVRVVPGTGYDRRVAEVVAVRLRDRVGDVEVEVVEVDAIPRTAANKFRAVVSDVDPVAPAGTTP